MINREDDRYYYGAQINPQEAEGVECPYCGVLFIVFATDDPAHPVKPIPPTGTTDYFCPCCGKNLREHILSAA